MQKKDYQSFFNKFAGKEVNVLEWQDYPVGGAAAHKKVTYRALDEKDPVVLSFKKAAAAQGLHLQLWLPNAEGALPFEQGRDSYVVGHVEKSQDGKWHIAPNFRIQ